MEVRLVTHGVPCITFCHVPCRCFLGKVGQLSWEGKSWVRVSGYEVNVWGALVVRVEDGHKFVE